MPKNGTPTISLADAYEVFQLDNQARRLAESTIEFYADNLPRFIEWCKSHDVTDVQQLTPSHIRTYLSEAQTRGFSGHTQHKYARVLRAFCNFLVRDEYLTVSPFGKISMPKLPKPQPKAFTQAEITSILKACQTDRDRAICLVLLDTGLRAGELCDLLVGDIDLKDGIVTVRSGKGDKERVTYIGVKTRKALLRYFLTRSKPEATDPAFTQIESNRIPLRTGGLSQLMNRLRSRTDIQHCEPHTFRRTFAIESLRSGMNIYVLARLMGHADIQVLRSYLDIVQTDLQAESVKHGVVDNLK